jgi:hypothetical protein
MWQLHCVTIANSPHAPHVGATSPMPILTAALRLLRCALGIASPSLVAAEYGRREAALFTAALGGKDAPALVPLVGTWLDKWERRLARAVQWPPSIEVREEVQVIERAPGLAQVWPRVVCRVDVTGRSVRATRRVLNRERRRAVVNGLGYTVRLTQVFT